MGKNAMKNRPLVTMSDDDLETVQGGNQQPLPWNRPQTNWTGAWGMQKVGTQGTPPGSNPPASIAQGDSIWDSGWPW